MADVYAVASWAGPVEAAILSELAPRFAVRRRAAGTVTVRYLVGGDGPAVCLLHDRGHASPSWAPLLPRLAAHHQVVAIDFPGFGHSANPPFQGGDVDQALSFFGDAVELLLWELGLREAALVGHGLGGYVAVELALRRMLAPRRLVLIGSLGLSDTIATAARMFYRAPPERLARQLGKHLYRGAALPKSPGGVAAELEHELAAIPGGRPAPAAAFGVLCPLVGPVPNHRARLHTIDAPTLVVWGDADPVVPAAEAVKAAAALPHGTVRVFDGLGHAPHLEEPDVVGAVVEAFLGQPS